ncbi:transposase, IS982 family protein [Catenovulum agarivorans DS-2]|uniref:Transposase, IS982 family protein n=1 Tax=Catenovulum agarivorans DS-2 TaxID=1328313 RepID=W7Q5H8_9ALTE|nr:IS982 family transposase [Catenovulum agarivorans]EWH08054.1 transposase, IS982 family protein [Catenovulum agarivorans DS-2]
MINLDAIYVDVDDFCLLFEPQWITHLIETGEKQRNKPSRLSHSEVMTILIAFHHSGFRDFKTYYIQFVSQYWQHHFPELVSYTRMLKLLQTVLPALCSYLKKRFSKPTGIAFIDSTTLKVCHNMRIPRNQVFSGVAERGKGTMGWFYGFKLHLIMNDEGGLLSVKVTAGNVDDRQPVLDMVENITGSLYADKGYISKQLEGELSEQGINFVTGQRKNMKPKPLSEWDKTMLSKRFIIETVFDQLKNIAQIEHSRHRSCVAFMVNLMAGLIAYTFQEKKPSIKVTRL